MKKNIIKMISLLNLMGFNPLNLISFVKGIPFFIRDYFKTKKELKQNDDFNIERIYPILNERDSESGIMKGHYFHQDLLIAQKIYTNDPYRHIDIGSRIDGFVAHVAAYREIEIFDIRPLDSKAKNIIFTQADLMHLPQKMKECTDSISSLHAIEHFGLGRYGDPIDVDGHLKVISNIYAMLKPNGKFYFSVPIGKQRIEFNAHRVFSLGYLTKMLVPKFKIENFSYVDDKGDLFVDEVLNEESILSSFNCHYGCGIFELSKI